MNFDFSVCPITNRFLIYCDVTQDLVDCRPSRKSAIKRALDLKSQYGEMTVFHSKSGKIVFKTSWSVTIDKYFKH